MLRVKFDKISIAFLDQLMLWLISRTSVQSCYLVLYERQCVLMTVINSTVFMTVLVQIFIYIFCEANSLMTLMEIVLLADFPGVHEWFMK